MRDNTPPRKPDFEEDDGDILEEITLDDGQPPDDDEVELEEVSLEELQNRLGLSNSDGDDDEFDEESARAAALEDEARIADIKDDAQYTFRGHSGPVFSCSLHPQGQIAATGGEDDRVFVWNTNNGEILHEINEHKDTVTEVHFSYDGNYLVSGDLSGEIFVHKLSENDNERPILRKVWEYSMGDMSWLCWHRGANVLLAGSDNGEIYVWRIPSGDCKILPGQGARTETAELTNDGKKLFASYNNGAVKLWDLKSCNVIMEIGDQHPMALSGTAYAVACDKDSPLYMCGGADGKILFCTNSGPVGAVQAETSVECLAFGPPSELHVAASGTLEGQIAIWDYTKYTMRTLCDNPNPGDGILRLKWLNESSLLAATTQGNLHCFDARTGAKKFTLTGHHYDIYEFVYDANEKMLLTVSEDITAKLFKLPELLD